MKERYFIFEDFWKAGIYLIISLLTTIFPLIISAISLGSDSSGKTTVLFEFYLILFINSIPQIELSVYLWCEKRKNALWFWIGKLICLVSSIVVFLYSAFGFYLCIESDKTKIICWDWVVFGMLCIPTVYALIELVFYIIGDGKINIASEKKTLAEKIELNKMNHI